MPALRNGRHAALASAVLGAMADPASGQPLLRPPLDAAGHPWQTAFCFVDVAQATYAIGEVAANINAAVIDCENQTTQSDRASCSAVLGNSVANLLYVFAYTASAVVQCANTTVVPALDASCTADVTGFLNGLATAWTVASSLASGTCQNFTGVGPGRRLQADARRRDGRRQAPAAPPPRDYKHFLRDLQSQPDLVAESRAREADLAFCVFDVGQSVFYLTRAIVALHSSVQSCQPVKLEGSQGQVLCTVDVAGMLGAVFYTAQYASLIVDHCPAGENGLALCAADIIGVLTVFTSLISSAAGWPASCGSLGKAAGRFEAEGQYSPNR